MPECSISLFSRCCDVQPRAMSRRRWRRAVRLAADYGAGAVEFYNRTLEVMTGDNDRAMAMDHARVMSASHWVRPGSD